MIFLPSLLEYSIEQMFGKIDIIQSNKKHFDIITNQTKYTELHLDFVLPQFARDRTIMTSLGFDTTFEILNAKFADWPLILTVHIMGEVEDMIQAYDFFKTYVAPKNWQMIIFVPSQYTFSWNALVKFQAGIRIGEWDDLGYWNTSFKPNCDYLLMTVSAGKSGQKLEEGVAQRVFELAEHNQSSRFILDGGWDVDFKSKLKNVKIVSYTSFWNTLKHLS